MHKNKLYLLLLPILLVSCASNSQNNGSENEEIEENCFIKEDTTIDFLCMADGSYHNSLQKMIDDFKEIEPHVTVHLYNPQGSGNYTMIEKTIVAGFFKEDYPDLAQCYPDNVVKYIDKGYAINIDKYLNNPEYGLNNEEKEDYIESFLLEGTNYLVDGTYSLPFCKSTELLYYNADALINLDLSSVDSSINNGNPLNEEYLNSLTWEELFDKLCPAIVTYNNSLPEEDKIMVENENSAVFTYDSDENFFITLANQYGYEYTSIDENGKPSIGFNNDDLKNLMKKLKVAKDNKYLQTKYTYENYVSYLFQGRNSLFTVSSNAGLSYNLPQENQKQFKVGVAKIPSPEGKEYSSINQGPSICILDHKDENRALASFLFWKHITNKENSSSWALDTGYMGIRNSSYQSEAYNNALIVDENSSLADLAKAANLVKISEVRTSTFNTPIFKGSGTARTNVGLILKDCLLSTDLNSEIDEIFEKYYNDTYQYLIKYNEI